MKSPSMCFSWSEEKHHRRAIQLEFADMAKTSKKNEPAAVSENVDD